MEEKSFEEKFPSLKLKVNVGVYDPKTKKEELICNVVEPSGFVSCKDIQEHCIDKQKVLELLKKGMSESEKFRKQAIKNKNSLEASAHRGANYAFESLKKELGL